LASRYIPPCNCVVSLANTVWAQVAKEFRRAGYKVYALVRPQEKSRELLKHEILPVIGNQNKPETYREYVKGAAVVVDTVPDYENSGAATKVLLQTITEVYYNWGLLFLQFC
jgi:uncharacterized protein YbjT (DUF2867 family)